MNNEEIKKLYFTMAEAVELSKTNEENIRVWCKTFSINPRRNRKGNRMFTMMEIRRLQIIYILYYIEGYTSKGIQNYLNL